MLPRCGFARRDAWRRASRRRASPRASRGARIARASRRRGRRPVVSTRSSSRRRAAPSARSTCRRRSTSIDGRDDARRAAAGQPVRDARCACPACSPRIARTTRRTCRSARAASARAPTFGVRGVRLYQDGIPVDDARRPGPDRQLQPAVGGAHRGAARPVLDALRQRVGRRDRACSPRIGRRPPAATFTVGGGSYGTWNVGVKLARHAASTSGYVVAAQPLRHRRLSRPFGGARATSPTRSSCSSRRRDTRITVIGNTQYQPETQDPLGLTRAQWEANPRGVDPGGAAVRHAQDDQPGAGRRRRRAAASATTRRSHVDAYGGRGSIRQYLALSGVGADVVGRRHRSRPRLRRRRRARHVAQPSVRAVRSRSTSAPTTTGSTSIARASSTTTATLGDLRRDEDDTVHSADAYARGRMVAVAGAGRHRRRAHEPACATSRTITSSTPQNPDDSGAHRVQRHEPGAGRRVARDGRPQRRTRATARASRRRRSPSSRTAAAAPASTSALQPATSRAAEIGVKALHRRPASA